MLWPPGGHHVEAVSGLNATDAAIRLREKLGLRPVDLEIVAVAPGLVRFTVVDAGAVVLAPHTAVT